MDGATAPILAPIPLEPTATVVRERIIGVPAGSRGQTFIEMIRFAAANRLLVEIDYRDQRGNRSTRAIEAYSVRRTQVGDILLTAVRADNQQSRSYRFENILGVRPTQTTFSPRYPIELTPSGPQSIPPRSGGASGLAGALRTSGGQRTSTRRAGVVPASEGQAVPPTYSGVQFAEAASTRSLTTQT